MNPIKRYLAAAALAWLAAAPGLNLQAEPLPLAAKPAQHTAEATRAMMLAATHAGQRLVAVGDHGIVLLSDDEGHSFRQAAAVPVSSALTAVHFANEREGWAVGHWGAILHTEDGGEHWRLQRLDTDEDRPLFSVHFFNARAGIAVGLWSLVLVTDDGGKHWNAAELPPPPEGGRADRNLFKVFVSAKGTVLIAAERGVVLRSEDGGRHWQYVDTGYAGSFWTGLGLANGSVLVAGLRGSLYRSTDDGLHWQALESHTRNSLTELVEVAGHIHGVGLDGAEIDSDDGGASFSSQQAGRQSMTTAIASGTGLVKFSRTGVLPIAPQH